MLDRSQWAALTEALAATPELALLAFWAEAAMVHACFLAEGEGSLIIASCAAPEGRYPALSPVRPGAVLFERRAFLLWLFALDTDQLAPEYRAGHTAFVAGILASGILDAVTRTHFPELFE